MDNQPDLFQWLKKIFFPGEEASAVKPEQDNAAKPETETAQTSEQGETSAESGKMPREQYEEHSESIKQIIEQKESIPKETIEEVIAEFKSLEGPSDARAAIQIPTKAQTQPTVNKSNDPEL